MFLLTYFVNSTKKILPNLHVQIWIHNLLNYKKTQKQKHHWYVIKDFFNRCSNTIYIYIYSLKLRTIHTNWCCTCLGIGIEFIKKFIKRGIDVFISYSKTRWITLPHTTLLSTTCKDLMWGSNMITRILWTICGSHVFKNKMKGFIAFKTSYCIF
jgi:hypothetical protein